MTFCWHRYTKWGQIVITRDHVAIQSKRCGKCGKVKTRWV